MSQENHFKCSSEAKNSTFTALLMKDLSPDLSVSYVLNFWLLYLRVSHHNIYSNVS